LETTEQIIGLVFLLNLIEDLAALMDWLDQQHYLSRQVLILEASETVAFPKIRRSLANNGWWMAK
jgi:hypothetical protein